MGYIGIIIFVLLVFGVIGIFLWADYRIKKRNKEEYERTGIMPEYKNTEVMDYVGKEIVNFYDKSHKFRQILAGIFTVIGGGVGLHVFNNWGKMLGEENMGPLKFFLLPLVGVVLYGIYAIIKGIRMK